MTSIYLQSRYILSISWPSSEINPTGSVVTLNLPCFRRHESRLKQGIIYAAFSFNTFRVLASKKFASVVPEREALPGWRAVAVTSAAGQVVDKPRNALRGRVW
jgi:hypothetical protein